VKESFAKWLQYRVKHYGFVEGEDFQGKFPKTPTKGRPRKDYLLTLDMAKELSMIERTDKGRAARRLRLNSLLSTSILLRELQATDGFGYDGQGFVPALALDEGDHLRADGGDPLVQLCVEGVSLTD